jgi:hypothetical protein
MSNLETVRETLDRGTDDVGHEAPYYGLERNGRPALAATLTAVQDRFDMVSYVVVDDFPAVDPDLVIVEVRGANRVRSDESGRA